MIPYQKKIRHMITLSLITRAAAADPAPIISVCMICHHLIGPDHRPAGTLLPSGAVVSHGVCRDCVPSYAAQLGLPQSAIDRLLSSTQTHNAINTIN
jgi:hypothetical protein